MSENKENLDEDALKSIFKISLETRNFEIAQLVQRNNFFMIFQGVLFAGFMQSSHEKPLVTLVVCCVGFVVSLFQAGMASGAKFWQEYWEETLAEIESSLGEHIAKNPSREQFFCIFQKNDNRYAKVANKFRSDSGFFSCLASWLIMKKYSVSRIPIYVGVCLAVIWFVAIFFLIDIQLLFSVAGL